MAWVPEPTPQRLGELRQQVLTGDREAASNLIVEAHWVNFGELITFITSDKPIDVGVFDVLADAWSAWRECEPIDDVVERLVGS